MPRYFHVNHAHRNCEPGEVFPLLRKLPGTTAYKDDLLRWLDCHPEGIIFFGLRHIAPDYHEPGIIEFSEPPSPAKLRLEMELETYRTNHCPDRPSRFVSIFGHATFGESKKFRSKARRLNPQFKASIWEINSASGAFRGDMNMLGSGPSDESIYSLYWQGGTNDSTSSDWELVIPLPAVFVRCLVTEGAKYRP
jgi:hypothetical protein